MAAPVASSIQVFDDWEVTGPRMRTQTRVVGADTVHTHYIVPVSARAKKVFHYSTPLISVVASSLNVTNAAFYLEIPAWSPVNLVVRKVFVHFGTTNVATNTAPRLRLARFSYTGTLTGATITPAKRRSVESSVCPMRMDSTGFQSLKIDDLICSFIVPQMHAIGQAFTPEVQKWPWGSDPFEDDDVIIEPGTGVLGGTGLLLYQADAGDSSDPRRFVVNLRVEEVDR
jgi:hypothetical protein